MSPRTPLPRPLRNRPFTVAEAREADVRRGRLRGPDLYQPFSGIRMPSAAARDAITLAFALQSTLPDDAFFSGVTAARVMGVPLPQALERSTELHVSVPSPAAAPRRKGVAGHSVDVSPGDIVSRYGIRISAPARLWCELAPSLGLADLVAAGDFLIHRRRRQATPEELHGEVTGKPRRRGNKKLIAALELLDDGAESRRESLLRVILVTGGIGPIVTNLEVTTSDGFEYRLDLALVRPKVAIEYQSVLHHLDPSAFRRDMTRISRLEADGWYVIQVNNDDLSDPEELVRRIRRVLAMRDSA